MDEISTEEIILRLKELIDYFERQKIKYNDEKELSNSFIP